MDMCAAGAHWLTEAIAVPHLARAGVVVLCLDQALACGEYFTIDDPVGVMVLFALLTEVIILHE